MAQRRTSSRREMSRGRGEAPAGVFRQVSSSSCRSRCLSKVGDGDIPGVDSVPHTGAGQDGDSEPDREWVHERDEAEARERVKSGKPRRPRASKVGLVALGRLVSEPPRGSRRSARTSRGGRSDATSASTSTRPNRMSPAMGTPVSSRAMWGVRNRRLISRSRPRSPGLRADRGFAPVLRSGTRPPRPGGLTPPRRQRL